MTSKEALNDLIDELKRCTVDGKKLSEYDKPRIKAIQKDLEVLEILKKHPSLLCCFAYDGVYSWKNFNETYSDEDKEYIGATKKEFEKVKEWLENDN